MSKIPRPTEEAINESYFKIIRKDFNAIDDKTIIKHLQKYQDEFEERQPDIYNFIRRISKGHMNLTQGLIQVPQLALYIIVIINSLYIQKEIDDVEDIFNQGD